MKRSRLSLVVALLAACAAPALSTDDIPIARAATFDLLTPASLGHAIALDQMVEVRAGESVTSMHCALEVESDQLRLVGLTAFGAAAFSLTLDERGLRVEQRMGGQVPADPRQILADLQLVLWPALPSLEGLRVVERSTAEGRVRELVRGEVTVVRIHYGPGLPWDAPLRLEHLERGYTLTVDTLSSESLAP